MGGYPQIPRDYYDSLPVVFLDLAAWPGSPGYISAGGKVLVPWRFREKCILKSQTIL